MTAYMPRIADALLAEKLASTGAVLVDGARATGKTRMAEIVAKSSVYLDRDPADRAAMRLDPATLLVGEPPTLIDEWQLEANRVWGYVRGQVDVRQAPGQFILTGSTTPESDLGRHSGVGRIARLRVRPMSTFESGESDGSISLARLMEGADVPGVRGADSLADVARRVVRGGWPTAVTRATKTAGQFAVDYVESVAEVDLGPLTDRKRNPERIKRLLRALARNTAMEHKIARIADETDGGQGALARATVYEH
jgi:predicted AAA+ superfamily ATPase